MGILEMIINRAAPTLGKSPQQLKTAIEHGKKIVQGAPSNVDGARKIMEENGIPTDFLDKAAKIVIPFSSIFGVKKENIMNDINSLKNEKVKTINQVEKMKNVARNRSKNNFRQKFPKI